mmetsp:Transcript_28540/g.47239  ORF Transcript_28540/g.47239 Transcript_28540/m.47239 type:complete len:419 (-) Transcript_28540:47-1303(-)|eukprot:CAMPEP_0119017562 /NCGR_PEP_ID=MMETSP1176-20130426/16962_1 /TAXON_ID=265551 /ORGANISM="Synedropsis recta cf, Strain CCMP1620" /LENGTH=418 /DNA_ID=CAMNT_0006971315 /DNA_START=105 /DNA_END=1361 /DNA_ORIENTATION=+
MSFFVSLFEDKLADNREPWIRGLEIPGVVEGSFSVYAPEPGPWIQLAVIFGAQTLLQCIFAAVIYLAIIQNRGKQFTYFIGYGVIIPLICYLPFPILELLDIKSRVVRLALTTAPTIVGFRCMEAMHGTSPAVAETSLLHYVAYYTCLFDFYWDEKTKTRDKISASELGHSVYRIVCHFFLLSLIVSYLLYYDFKPFASAVELDQYHLTLELLEPGQLFNNYLYAVMTFFGLSLGWNLAALSTNLQGFRTVVPFHNPLWTSRSPSDFWGKKWNTTIHGILKRAAFQPVKKAGYSTSIAILATFAGSGVLHEYAWAIMFSSTTHDYDENGNCVGFCWYPLIGKQMVFFAWCGTTMLLERPVAKLPSVQWMSKNLPTVVISTLVVATVLPFAHWYPGDWIVSQYWHDYSVGLFKIGYEPA